MSTTRDYVVTALAGPLIAGRPHGPTGAPLSLTDEEALYELLLGTITTPGGTAPLPAPPPAALADVVRAYRGALDHSFTVEQLRDLLFANLLRPGEGLAAVITAAITTVNADVAGLIAQAVANRLRVDDDQELATAKKARGRANLAAAAAGENADIVRLLGVDGAGIDFRASETAVGGQDIVDLGAIATLRAAVTFTGPIGSFGSTPGLFRLVRFVNAGTLTNSPVLLLPDATDIPVKAGARAVLVGDSTGRVHVAGWINADGTPLKAGTLREEVSVVTASGIWAKPAWAREITVYAMGGGGGAGSGRRGATGSIRGGGGPGGAGALNYETFLATEIDGNLTIAIGAGGAGGAAQTVDGTNGIDGTVGGSTTIADTTGSLLTAAGGGQGGGGTSAGVGAAGSAGQNISMLAVGTGGGNGSIGSGGGGAGGQISAAEVAGVGGTSGYGYNLAAGNHRAGRVSGGAVGAAGAAGNPKAWTRGGAGGGSGGGSGAADGSSPGGAGGTGGIPGAGAGGGGGATNGAASGAGGAGGRGEVWIICRG